MSRNIVAFTFMTGDGAGGLFVNLSDFASHSKCGSPNVTLLLLLANPDTVVCDRDENPLCELLSVWKIQHIHHLT